MKNTRFSTVYNAPTAFRLSRSRYCVYTILIVRGSDESIQELDPHFSRPVLPVGTRAGARRPFKRRVLIDK